MQLIKLTSGNISKISDADLELVSKHNWYENDQGYAYTKYYKDGKQIQLRMHRLIMNTPDGKDTDHINRNRLDNRRSNLRIVDRTTNNFNTGLYSHNTSGHKGVGWHKAAGKWVARIQYRGKTIHLGCFNDIKNAISARKLAEEQYIL